MTHPDPTKHITVSLCGETIDFVDTMQLPMKQDVAACVEKGSNGTVTLTRETDGLSYGGVFVRYYKDIDEIEGTGRGMPMSVERQLEEEFCFYIAQKERDFPQYSPLKIETENDKAVDMGLNGLIIGAFNKGNITEEFQLPYEPLAILAIGSGAETIRLVPTGVDESRAYYRNAEGVHFVPKVRPEELVIP